MTTETTTRICEHLEKYVFDKIWNDPYSEYKTFIVLESLSSVATAGVFFERYDQIQLPSEVSYRDKNASLFFYLYSVPATYFGSIKVGSKEWVSLDNFGSAGILDFEMFNEHGKHCNKAAVFIKQAPSGDNIIVAVESTAFMSCFGKDASPSDKYFFGKTVDSDLVASVRYESFKLKAIDLPSSRAARSNQKDPILVTGQPTYTLYNGTLLTGDYLPILAVGALIEKVYDDNIAGYFDVPVELDNTYQPDGTYKLNLLIHIPKSLNPKSAIITPDTCDIFLVPTLMKEGRGHPSTSSIYLYQCGRADKFTQITHNDFAIDYEWLRSLAEENGYESFSVRVYVREPFKDKYAIRDANYLNVLYTHEDNEIVDFLLDRSSYKIDFWKASALQKGLYGLATLKRRHVGKHYTLNEFVDLIGYYHTLALIGKRVTHFEVVSESTGSKEFVVNAPLALADFSANDFFPVVYLNGIRVDQSNVEVRTGIHASNMHNKELTFTPDASWWTKVIEKTYSTKLRVIVNNVPIRVGDKVVVELLDNQTNASIKVIEVEEDSSVKINNVDQFDVYIVHDEEDLNNVSYEHIYDPGDIDEEGNLVFNETLIGWKVLVVDGSITKEDAAEFHINHASTYHIGKELWADPITNVDNFPLDNELVFMNDRGLTRGLDYTMDGYKLPSRRYGAKLYVQNISYLRPTNKVSVIRTTQKMLSHRRGFITGNIVTWNNQNPFWFDELSIMTIDGNVCSNLIHEFGTISIKDAHDNGSPFEFRMSVSSVIPKLLSNISLSEDNAKLDTLQKYFASKYEFPDHLTIVQHPHRLYSLYLEQIISDYFETSFDFQLVPSKELFEEQFDAYSEWKKRDVVFGLSEHDLKFVDIAPMYNTYQISDGYQYKKLTELIRRLMPSDSHKYKDTRNVK